MLAPPVDVVDSTLSYSADMDSPARAERPHVLVTGASRGIGRAIAEELGRDWHVLVGGTTREGVDAVVATLPSAEPFVADLADEEATAAAAARLTTLDALVHSAGLAGGGRIADLTREDLRRIFEVNVFAVADLTRLLLPLLRASHDGHVVALNSGSGLGSGTAGSTAYNGSKHALRILTDALREEERGSIRVTSIHPGRTDSDMQRTLQARLGNDYDAAKFIRPEAVAELVRTALETSPEAQLEMLSIRPVITS
jgi:NAD(P)-dependent dehydrogenase (short-subunit alcohol dehydrogenase family)